MTEVKLQLGKSTRITHKASLIDPADPTYPRLCEQTTDQEHCQYRHKIPPSDKSHIPTRNPNSSPSREFNAHEAKKGKKQKSRAKQKSRRYLWDAKFGDDHEENRTVINARRGTFSVSLTTERVKSCTSCRRRMSASSVKRGGGSLQREEGSERGYGRGERKSRGRGGGVWSGDCSWSSRRTSGVAMGPSQGE